MRFKTIVALMFATSLAISASVGAAERPAQDSQAQSSSTQSSQTRQQSPNAARRQRRTPGRFGAGMMTPDMMRMMASMMGGPGDSRGASAVHHRERMRGPLQPFSRILAALDNPAVRATLGLSDKQADSLRKIVIDTETYSITTGASMLVDGIQLRELLRADKPDKATVMAKGDAISKSASQLIDHYLNAILAAKAILTPEQQRMIRMYMARGSLRGAPSRP